MQKNVRRIYVEKKREFAVEAQGLLTDLREFVGVRNLEELRIVNRYDVSGITEAEYQAAKHTIFSEPTVDVSWDEELPMTDVDCFFAVEYLPGQYDQRADSAAQCIQILTQKDRPKVSTAKVILLKGKLSQGDFEKIKEYCINPLESRTASMIKPESLDTAEVKAANILTYDRFIEMDESGLNRMMDNLGFAMSLEDLKFCQTYFRDMEKRNPTVTELKVIDTYWSDHCRHTTFLTNIEQVNIEEGLYNKPLKTAYTCYENARQFVYGNTSRDMNLMDIAVIGMKELRKQGKLEDLEVSGEINACSITVNVDVNGNNEEWLVMFKNETHNHPTEIEPFGGAATCLGGAIRDPLSGRSYVYGAMRVTGSADPRTRVEDTIPGKLPQRKITTGAAAGYSAYGNQIGLATGQVAEIYDEGYMAKRMEIGAVLGATPKANVVRQDPEPGDIVILLGGRTGRDGCGGATGSSKEHTEESLTTCGAEVQKGNPPTERKIQRLFRKREVSRMIKKCNDFGAGGVAVAIGELAEGLDINLDIIPKKYEGLDGTELAISESQERMAVVVNPQDMEAFIKQAAKENLEAVTVAVVTDTARLKMFWRGKAIVDIERKFLDTNGVAQYTTVQVKAPEETCNYFEKLPEKAAGQAELKTAWLENLKDLNVCSQKGLVERFDSSIGAGTVLMPFGGRYQDTPAEGLVMKVPVQNGETRTGTVMTYGYNPKLSCWSPFHGAFYAVIESVAKVVALGGDYRKVRLTLQEYFEKLGKDPVKWGKPFSALLGAYYAQSLLEIPAIGGKDSMSGTFKDLNVPPTLVSFAVDVMDITKAVSQELKSADSKLVLLTVELGEDLLPDMKKLETNFDKVAELINKGLVRASSSIRYGGLAAAVSKMSFGNRIGIKLDSGLNRYDLFSSNYGAILLEMDKNLDIKGLMGDAVYKIIGETTDRQTIECESMSLSIDEACTVWKQPLESVFHTETDRLDGKIELSQYDKRCSIKPAVKAAKPRVFIPAFPGTNCEMDTAKAFQRAGAEVEVLVFRNLTPHDIEASIEAMVKSIGESQIIALPGGFSAGDEPDGSGKFIATAFRNPSVKDAVMTLLSQRDGLMIGICNGFQALIKLGLLPYGEIRDITADCPTLTYNKIGRHVSRMVNTKVVSTLSPWLNNVNAGDCHSIVLSHGEGRFIASGAMLKKLSEAGQIATVYADFEGNPSYDIAFNPNGSDFAIEGITSPDGRIFGKMGHSERISNGTYKNIPGEKDQKLFEAGVKYFL